MARSRSCRPFPNVLCVMCCCLGSVAMVNSQNDTDSALAAQGPLCGNTQRMVDDCFQDLPPHLMEFLQKTKITINEEEITSKCIVFARGMACFDEYTSRCLSKRKHDLFKTNVEGARRFFKKFCADHEFQKDYLQHKDCFAYIQDDWVRCTRTFHQLVSDELHSDKRNVTDKFMEFCCARYAYENCIYNSARFKCYLHSAAFARSTAQMLSEEKHFTNCRQYEKTLCTGGANRLRWISQLFLPLLLLLLTLN